MEDNRTEGRGENSLSTLEFSIGELPRGTTPMKNIPFSALPNFHGLSSEDPDEFLMQRLIISSKGSLEMSPFPSMFNMSR